MESLQDTSQLVPAYLEVFVHGTTVGLGESSCRSKLDQHHNLSVFEALQHDHDDVIMKRET